MRYAFILGRVFTLSVAELLTIFDKPDAASGLIDNPVKVLDASKEVLIIETEKPLLVLPLQKKLGGVVKILRVVDVLEKRKQDSVNFAVKNYFKPSLLKKEFFKEYKGKKKRVGRQQVSSMLLITAIRRISENFPILKEAKREVLEDLMDIQNLKQIIEEIEKGKIEIKEISTQIPSPFAFNLVLQGYTDILKFEDRMKFLRNMHQLVLAKINLKK